MAKTKAKEVPPPRHSRQSSAEQWNRRLIVGGVVAAIIVVVGLVAFGWWQTQIRPLGKTVLKVGDTEVSLAHLERRVDNSLRQTSSALQTQDYLLALPGAILAGMEREARLLEAAHELNDIEVTDEDLDAEIRQRAGLSANATAGQLVAELSRQVEESSLKEGEYLQMVRAELLEAKVLAYFTFVGPREEPQVLGRQLVLDTEEDAQATLDRLEAGEDFDSLAAELPTDPAVAESGTLLDWRPRGGLPAIPAEVEIFLFDAEVGDRSEAIEVSNAFAGTTSWHIVELIDKEEERDLDETQRPRVVQRLVEEWLVNLDLTVENNLTQEDSVRVINDIL